MSESFNLSWFPLKCQFSCYLVKCDGDLRKILDKVFMLICYAKKLLNFLSFLGGKPFREALHSLADIAIVSLLIALPRNSTLFCINKHLLGIILTYYFQFQHILPEPFHGLSQVP